MQSLEAQFQESCVKKQLQDLQRQLELLEVEKKEVEGRLEQTEKKNEELEKRGGWKGDKAVCGLKKEQTE